MLVMWAVAFEVPATRTVVSRLPGSEEFTKQIGGGSSDPMVTPEYPLAPLEPRAGVLRVLADPGS